MVSFKLTARVIKLYLSALVSEITSKIMVLLLDNVCILYIFLCPLLIVEFLSIYLRNDLYCVEWGTKLYSNEPTIFACMENSIMRQDDTLQNANMVIY